MDDFRGEASGRTYDAVGIDEGLLTLASCSDDTPEYAATLN